MYSRLLTFFGLCFGLSWAMWVPLAIFRETVPGSLGFVLVIVGSVVPSVVALLLTGVADGRDAVRRLLGRFLVWPIGIRWFAVLLLPTAIVLVAITANAQWSGGPQAALGVPALTAVVMVLFSIFPGSATGEEIGWRAYALPRLQTRRNALTASLVLGALSGLWHLPLWLTGQPGQPLALYPAFLIQVIALAVIYTWLYNSTNGSLLLAVLFHAAANAPITLVLVPLGAVGLAATFWMISGLMVLAAIVVIMVFGPTDLSRRPRQVVARTQIRNDSADRRTQLAPTNRTDG